jgi:hypothetical protein
VGTGFWRRAEGDLRIHVGFRSAASIIGDFVHASGSALPSDSRFKFASGQSNWAKKLIVHNKRHGNLDSLVIKVRIVFPCGVDMCLLSSALSEERLRCRDNRL